MLQQIHKTELCLKQLQAYMGSQNWVIYGKRACKHILQHPSSAPSQATFQGAKLSLRGVGGQVRRECCCFLKAHLIKTAWRLTNDAQSQASDLFHLESTIFFFQHAETLGPFLRQRLDQHKPLPLWWITKDHLVIQSSAITINFGIGIQLQNTASICFLSDPL